MNGMFEMWKIMDHVVSSRFEDDDKRLPVPFKRLAQRHWSSLLVAWIYDAFTKPLEKETTVTLSNVLFLGFWLPHVRRLRLALITTYHAALRKLSLLRPATIPTPRIRCSRSQQSLSFLRLSSLWTSATPARRNTIYSVGSTGRSASYATSESTPENSYHSRSSVQVCFEETSEWRTQSASNIPCSIP